MNLNRKQLIASIFLGLFVFSLTIPSIYAKTSRKNALISFIEECQWGTGFGNTPGATDTTLESMFQAYYILDAYDKIEYDCKSCVEDYVNETGNEDHGFGARSSDDSEIFSTYYALWLSDLLEVQYDNDTDEWLDSCYNESDGFSDVINGTVSLYATYFGLEAMYMNSTDLSGYNCSTWLLERQNTNSGSEDYGGFATDGNSSNMWATWAAMGSLDRLNVSEGFLIEPLVAWINQSQNLNIYDDDYGGFSSGPSESDYSLLHTYAAIYCLQKLGDTYLSRIDLDAALDWLLELQNEDGGFRVNFIAASSTLSASYYAFCTLELLGEENRLLADVPWEEGLLLPLWLWILIVAVIAITAILIIRKYYLY